MSKRTRSASWFEGRILQVLSKHTEITTYLALSALSVGEGIGNLEEQFHMDVALCNLISRKLVRKLTDKDGFVVYQLAA